MEWQCVVRKKGVGKGKCQNLFLDGWVEMRRKATSPGRDPAQKKKGLNLDSVAPRAVCMTF